MFNYVLFCSQESCTCEHCQNGSAICSDPVQNITLPSRHPVSHWCKTVHNQQSGTGPRVPINKGALWRKQWREGNQFSYEHCHNTAVKQSFKVDWTIPQRGCVNQRHSKKIFHDLFHVSLVKRRLMHGRVSFAIVLNYPTTFMQNFINMVCIEWMKFWRRIYKEFVRETVYPSGKISLKCKHV